MERWNDGAFFEQYDKKPANGKEAEAGYDRREFGTAIGGLSVAAGGYWLTQKFGFKDKIQDLFQDDIEQPVETAPTEEKEEIECDDAASIEEIINFDQKGRLEFAGTIEKRLTEYWKKKYVDKPNLYAGLKKAYYEMGAWSEKIKRVFHKQKLKNGAILDAKLAELAIPESHWDPNAVSPVGAAGPYQFMEKTGREYGLDQFVVKSAGGKDEVVIDERRDPIKSAEAAAKFLAKLIDECGGDERLALSRYNGGYFGKYKRYAEEIGEEISYEGFLKYVELRINTVRDEIKSGKDGKYTAEKKDTLNTLAQRFGVTESELKAHNELVDDTLIVGSIIKIPFVSDEARKKYFYDLISGYKQNLNYPPKFNAITELIREGAVHEQAPEAFFKTLTVEQVLVTKKYRAQRGKTVAEIAAMFGITVEDLTKANQDSKPLKKNAKYPYPSEVLNIPNQPQTPTLFEISKSKNRPLEHLQKLNPAILNAYTQLPDGYEVRY